MTLYGTHAIVKNYKAKVKKDDKFDNNFQLCDFQTISLE